MDKNLDSVQQDFTTFIGGFRTAQLATVSPDGWPESSYAPFVRLDGVWYVYLSELAQHTRNLLENPRLSLMLIEAEDAAAHVFARKRTSLRMAVSEVPRETNEWLQVMDAFDSRFGDIMQVLRGLTDFHLFALRPQQGVFVRGFAQAFELGGGDMLVVRHVRDRGHRPQAAEGAS